MKIQVHFAHMETEPLSLWCYDSASRCRYELPLSDGDKVYKWQSEYRKPFLTLIESRFSYVNSRHVREGAVNPALSLLKTASLHFHIYPLKKKKLSALTLYLLSSCHTQSIKLPF